MQCCGTRALPCAQVQQLSRPPVIWNFLVVEMPNARDERLMALFLCPIDRFALRPRSMQHVVSMILNHEVGDRAAIGSPLWTRFNIKIGHISISSLRRLFRPTRCYLYF